MNVRLLRRVAKHILAQPKRLQMEQMHTPINEIPVKLRPPCGTACCIAGWAVVLGAKTSKFDGYFPAVNGYPVGLSQLASMDLLDMPNQKLFFTEDWPEKFRARFEKAKRPTTKANIAVACIEDYIKTSGWTKTA